MSTIVAATGAAGNWTDGSAWVGGIAPTAGDDAQITVLTTSITINSGALCRSADFTGFTGTCTHSSGATLTIGDGTAGLTNIALKLVAGMTYTLGSSSSSAISFVSTSTTQQTVATGGKTVGNFTFNGVGGSWVLSDSLTSTTSATLNLTAGTLDTGSQSVTYGTYLMNGSTTRVFTLGGSSISVLSFWQMGSTNMTLNANTSTITLGTIAIVFAGAGFTYNNVIINTNGDCSISSTNTFANLTRTGPAIKTSSLTLSANQTITGTLTVTGDSLINRTLVQSSTAGTARTLTAAAVSLTNSDFMDITASGAASPFTGTSLGDALGNTNITFTAAVTRYWVGGTGNWSSTGEWASSSGGASGASVPLCHDTVVFDGNSFTAGGQTATADMPRMGAGISFTGVTNSPTLALSASPLTFFGSFTLATGMTVSGTVALLSRGRSSLTFTSAGISIGSNSFTIIMPGGTLTLQDSFSMSTFAFTLSNGTFNANNFNVTTAGFSSSDTTTRTLTMGSGLWTLNGSPNGFVWSTGTTTGLTFNVNTSTILVDIGNTSERTFSGGALTYNRLIISGISNGKFIFQENNTFNYFQCTSPGKDIRSILSTNTTFKEFNVSGLGGSLVTIGTYADAGAHTFTMSGVGKTGGKYLSISNSTASPASTWFAGSSTNGGGNTNWTFGIAGIFGPTVTPQRKRVTRPTPFSPGLGR